MRAVRSFIDDTAGGAIVEFALILPVMLFLLFASAELVQGFDAKRRVDHVAYAVADVVAQSRSVSQNDVDQVFAGGQVLIEPLPKTTLGQRLASFTANDAGVVSRDWGKESGTYADAGSIGVGAVPTGFLRPGQSVIIAEARYTYTPRTSWVLKKGLTFQSRAFLRPRAAVQVPLTP